MPIRWSISRPQTDEHRVWVQCSHALASAGDPDKIADIAAIRKNVEGPWMNAHVVRTVAVMVALTFLCRALWLRRGGEASGSGAAPARPSGNES